MIKDYLRRNEVRISGMEPEQFKDADGDVATKATDRTKARLRLK